MGSTGILYVLFANFIKIFFYLPIFVERYQMLYRLHICFDMTFTTTIDFRDSHSFLS